MEYARKDNRFRVTSHEKSGSGLTRNKAMEETKGDYIVFLDSDDYIEIDYFESLVSNISNTNADVIFIDVVQESPEGMVIKNEFSST